MSTNVAAVGLCVFVMLREPVVNSDESTNMPGGDDRPQTSHRVHDEVSVREIYALVARGKWLVISVTAITSVLMLGVALILPNEYLATTVVAPVSANSGTGSLGHLSSMLSGMGSFASVLGFQTSQSLEEAEEIATVNSQLLTRKYITQNSLLPTLFASKWNSQTKNWKTADARKIPTLWEADRYFRKKVLVVSKDKKTGLVHISITWTDPRLAAKWANGLVNLTNSYLRNRAIREANANIAYLKEQAESTAVVQVREEIYSLMQGEIRAAMVAQGQHAYALKVIDPAYVREKPSSPKPVLWALGGMIMGLLLSFGTLVVRQGWSANA